MASPKSPVFISAAPSSEVHVLDCNEPLVASSSSGPPCGQVLESSDLQIPTDPLGPMTLLSESEPDAGCSRATVASTELVRMPSSPTSSESSTSDAEAPRASGSSRRRIHYRAEEIRSHWNMYKLMTRLNTPAQCIAFAEERRLIPVQKMCNYHKKPMTLSSGTNTGQLGIFRCRKSNCRSKTVSRAAGTWFENARLSIELQFQLMYMFSQKYSHHKVKLETAREEPGSVLSSRTISNCFSNCRKTVVAYELEQQVVNGKIGGPGKIVQIDVTKFVISKFNKGKHTEGHWVLGMVEDGKDDIRLEVCTDNQNGGLSEALVPLIKKHVEIGTEIHTDLWSAYDCLPQYGYIHKKLNHSDQRIQSQWQSLKMMFENDSCKYSFTDWVIEYSWRRKIRINHKDVFEELIKAIGYVYKID